MSLLLLFNYPEEMVEVPSMIKGPNFGKTLIGNGLIIAFSIAMFMVWVF